MRNNIIPPRSAIHNPRSAIRNFLGRRILAPFARARSAVVALAGGLAVLLAAHQSATAGGVAVGSSTLIGTLQYSDTFTQTAIRTDGTYPVPAGGLAVENSYGNPARSWTSGKWSINRDATVSANGAPYIGSGAGTATGMTQTGGGVDYGIEYGLSNQFVVQFDAFQPPDRIDIGARSARDTIGGSGLSVFIRPSTAAVKIGLYNGSSEINSGLTTSGIAANTWHNYAVKFDNVDKTIEVFVDQVSCGVVNLATLNGGSHNTISNAAVSVGGTPTSSRFWSDNFQVGLPNSDPTACDMLSFNWGAYNGVIVGTDVQLTVLYGTDVATLNPTYTVSRLAAGDPGSGTVRNFTTPKTYRVTAQDGVTYKDYTVTVTVSPPSTTCDMLSFNWGASSGVISGTDVTLTVPVGTDVTALNPTCTVSAGAAISPVSGTTRNFTSPQTYTVTAQDGINHKDYTVTVAFSPVITLIGGDAGEGFAPLSNTYAAVSLSQTGVGPVQGVTFNTNASAVTMTGNPGATGGGANFTQTTTDDTNLAKVFTAGYYTGGSMTATVTGLTAGLVYQLDSFIGVMGSTARTEFVQVWDGLTPLTSNVQVDLLGGNPSPAYDVRQTFTAPAGGTVQVKYTGSFFPLLCGLAITYATPPSTACDLLSFSWGGYTGVIDEGATPNPTVTVHVPDGTPLNPLNPNPTYVVSPGAACPKPNGGTGSLNFTSPQTYTVTAADGITAKEYHATFVAVSPHTITASAGANGSISPTGDVSVAHGGSQAFTITPDTGYVVADVVVDGTTHLGSVTTYTFTNVQANHTIAATFMSNPVIILTGGDAGEGFAPMSAVHAAVSFNQTGVGPVQGVAFNTNASAVTMTGNNTTTGGGANFTQTTTDDTNLAKVFTAGYYTGGSMTATVTGLIAGREYQLDSFIGVMGSSGRTEYVQVWDGSTPLTANVQVDLTGGNPSPAYDVRQTFTAPAGGTVQVKYTGTFFPLVCGVAITYAATTATAPAITGITAGNGKLSVAFTAPSSDGGRAISDYRYSTDNGTSWTSAGQTTSPILISSLTNGTPYQVKILAVTSIGDGAPSDAVSGTPTPSTACDMVSFEAAGVSGTITPGAPNTVVVTLPPGTDVSALTPTVVVSQWATYAPTETQDFTNSVTTPVPYTVTADDGINQQVYQVTVAFASRPPNDDFANAIALPGTNGIQTGTGNRYATLETDEPDINGATHTVWFKWTAPSNGSYTISTVGSTKLGGGEWDAMLGIYTGSAVDALTAVPGLPDGNPQDTDVPETMTVTVTAGTTYRIQAAGFEDQVASNIKLTCTFVSSGGTSYGTWETANGASGGASADSNNNGVPNGVEFFMGGTQASPATLPALVNTAGTWSWTIPYDPAALATYKFRVSDNLSGWTDIVPPDASITVLTSPDRIQFTLPAGTGKKFCQLVVITP